MNKLLEGFQKLDKGNKIDFVKKIMPEMCETFSDNPQEMMSMCKSMMNDCKMDMSQMMSMISMRNK